MPILLILKKMVARILFPIPLFFIILITGIYFSFFSKKYKKLGKVLVISSVTALFVMSISGKFLLATLTTQYPAFTIPKNINNQYTILVLGSGFHETPTDNPIDNFSYNAQNRLLEGCRIARMLIEDGKQVKLVISTGNTEAEPEVINSAVNAFIHLTGLDDCNIEVYNEAYNTREEIAHIKNMSGVKVIVSNAYHIPRAMQLAQIMGVAAIAAPAAIPQFTERISALDFIPSADNLEYGETAVYELLGMIENALFY